MMIEFLVPYSPTIWGIVAMGGLLVAQLLVADLVGLKAGHKPGAPVAGGPKSLHFRVARAHANTNESLAAFALLAVGSIFLAASPYWTNLWTWIYVAARLGHMTFYYLGISIARSVAFGVSLVGLFGLLWQAVRTLF